MTDTNDILPCPHCGSNNVEPAFSRGYDAGDMTQPVIAAGCMDCGAAGPSVKVPDHSTGYEVATKAWNIRHSQLGEAVGWIVTTPSGYKKRPRAILRSQYNVEDPDFWYGGKPPEDAIIEPLYRHPPAPAAVPAEMQKDSERAKWHQGYEKAVADIADAVNEIMDGKAPEKTFGVSPLWAPTRERLIDFAKSHSAAAVPEADDILVSPPFETEAMVDAACAVFDDARSPVDKCWLGAACRAYVKASGLSIPNPAAVPDRIEWAPGKTMTREHAIKILNVATDREDPYWINLVEDFYDEETDNWPSIYDVFAAIGVTKSEYIAVTGADNVGNWPAVAPAAVPEDCSHCGGAGDVSGEPPGIACPLCNGTGVDHSLSMNGWKVKRTSGGDGIRISRSGYPRGAAVFMRDSDDVIEEVAHRFLECLLNAAAPTPADPDHIVDVNKKVED